MTQDSTSTKIKPIETKYKGYRFRSRLEARWAIFFDSLGIKWEYEPEGYNLREYGWYLPDFYLPQPDYFAEVKPENVVIQKEKYIQFAKLTQKAIIILVGTPDLKFYNSFVPATWETNDHVEEYDVFVSTYHNYYIDEHRFYGCPGSDDPSKEGVADDCDYIAIEAARSARFEHGERP